MIDWTWSTIIDAFPYIFEAMWTVLGLTVASFIFALLFGIVWTALRRIRWKPVHAVVVFLLNFIRSTPPLVQLFFLYYAWPQIPYVGVTLTTIQAAVIGLGLHFSTYISEIYRSGINDVKKGQWEAATALNYSRWQLWTKIILPQALPPVIPMLGNYLIIMFKEIPLTLAIGVAGMVAAAKNYGAQHFEFIEPLTLTGFFFLVLSYPSALFVRWLEKKTNRRFEKKRPQAVDTDRKDVTA
ncbi:MAG TPA: ectoine/hydroxyectoine ABC transporter permease subunit EhuD [Bacillales bacterium]|nr:ectoine/hydroxyectoine ABC transporter permease subunit EhuD [Bacillales bacterium]